MAASFPMRGTFLVFSDYCRPSIRLAALMGIRVIYVMTHDSIGLGEDGPTHQPVEHLAALRAIPNLLVFRPADAVETAECWEIALRTTKQPSLLCALRARTCRRSARVTPTRISPRKGAYELRRGRRRGEVTFLATGSEVEIALDARDTAARRGIAARVVSMPCWELFEEQPATYRDSHARPRHGKSRHRSGGARWAGIAISGRMAASSACTASARARRTRMCTSISASRPKLSADAARAKHCNDGKRA